MKRALNLLSFMIIGGTLGVNNIHWNSFSFWIILVCAIVAEHTADNA